VTGGAVFRDIRKKADQGKSEDRSGQEGGFQSSLPHTLYGEVDRTGTLLGTVLHWKMENETPDTLNERLV
jgi:hypothetical protein